MYKYIVYVHDNNEYMPQIIHELYLFSTELVRSNAHTYNNTDQTYLRSMLRDEEGTYRPHPAKAISSNGPIRASASLCSSAF